MPHWSTFVVQIPPPQSLSIEHAPPVTLVATVVLMVIR